MADEGEACHSVRELAQWIRENVMLTLGGVDGLYVSIPNQPFMRLVIEHIGEGPHGLPAISVAHYYEINGDLCQDPEMCFEIESTQKGIVMRPHMFQMATRPSIRRSRMMRKGVALREELLRFAATALDQELVPPEASASISCHATTRLP
jgi:hypothetical protein